MREDTAGRIHRDQYGRSGKANATENQNREFQDSYRAGVDTLGEDTVNMISEEGHLRAEVSDDLSQGFDKWFPWLLSRTSSDGGGWHQKAEKAMI